MSFNLEQKHYLLKNKNILITGASGFIGKHLVENFKNLNCNLFVMSRDTISFVNCYSIKCDLSKKSSVKSVRKTLPEFNVIIHLAALTPTHENMDDYSLHIKNNFNSTTNLVQFISRQTELIIFASTLDVYGEIQNLPVTESHPTNPVTYYGASKLASEKFLKLFCDKNNIRLAILRFSHIFGPGEKIIKFIPNTIKKLIYKKEIIINNNGYDTRDYIYIDDVIRIIISIVKFRVEGILNIANGIEISMNTLISELIKIHNGNSEIKYLPSDNHVSRIYFDISLLRKTIEFSPQITLFEGLKRQYDEMLIMIENNKI